MTIYDEIIKMSKINKFNCEMRTKDGTFLILDGEFNLGVSVKVQTSEGLVDLPDGPVVLGTPYDGVIIEIIKGKVKQIINPLKNEPTPNPLETPPMMSDGAIGIVGAGLMEKQNKDMNKQKFDDNAVTTASNGTASTDNTKATDGTDSTVQTDKANVYTIEQLSSMIDDAMGQLKTLSDRVTALEGGDQSTDTTNTANTANNSNTDQQNTQQKMNAEVKAEVDKQVKEYFEKNSPAKSINTFDVDEEDKEIVDPTMLKVKQLEILKKRNKK